MPACKRLWNCATATSVWIRSRRCRFSPSTRRRSSGLAWSVGTGGIRSRPSSPTTCACSFVTAGYHRYFSHRAFKTSRVFQFFLALHGRELGAKGRALVGGASPRSSQVLRPAERHPLAAPERPLVVARRLDLVAQVRRDEVRAHPGLRAVSRAALAQQVPPRAAGAAGGGDGRSSAARRCSCGASSCRRCCCGTAPSPSTRCRTCSARCATRPNDDSKNNCPARAHHRRRGLAQQPPLLPVDGEPGLLLVGDRHVVLRA